MYIHRSGGQIYWITPCQWHFTMAYNQLNSFLRCRIYVKEQLVHIEMASSPKRDLLQFGFDLSRWGCRLRAAVLFQGVSPSFEDGHGTRDHTLKNEWSLCSHSNKLDPSVSPLHLLGTARESFEFPQPCVSKVVPSKKASLFQTPIGPYSNRKSPGATHRSH